MASNPQPLIYTPGDPAGVGPDLVLLAASQTPSPLPIAIISCPKILDTRIKLLKLDLRIQEIHEPLDVCHLAKKTIGVIPCPNQEKLLIGTPTIQTAPYVIKTLEVALKLMLDKKATAWVTGPLHKGVINDAGIPFEGHTRWLQLQTQTDDVVMMLASPKLKVALVTDHVPLKDVPSLITEARIFSKLSILIRSMKDFFGLKQPAITVSGLNPHAGEGGHLGQEEELIIKPSLEKFRISSDAKILGPLSADSMFIPSTLNTTDAFLAMYHDQGLTGFKSLSFNQAANITLGLPFIRTSVDHGTACNLAGTHQIHLGSFHEAVRIAQQLANQTAPEPNHLRQLS